MEDLGVSVTSHERDLLALQQILGMSRVFVDDDTETEIVLISEFVDAMDLDVTHDWFWLIFSCNTTCPNGRGRINLFNFFSV